MSTVNVSLTQTQVQLADHLTREYDFANRSELFRDMMRLLAIKPDLLRVADEILLAPNLRSWRAAFLLGDKIGQNFDLDDEKIIQEVKSLRKSRGIKIKNRS